MTRQEALHELYTIFGYGFYNERVDEALKMAIKALEQEAVPSEDCIDRYSALAELNPLSDDYKAIKELPSVVPSGAGPKRGKWIKATGMMPPEYHGHHYCSECGNFANMRPPFGNREDLSKYCPNCGAKME